VTSQPGSFAGVTRTWQSGDVVDVTMPLSLHTEAFRDNPRRQAVLHGPLVLAAEVPSRKAVPVAVTGEGKVLDGLQAVAGKPSTFAGSGEVFRPSGGEKGPGVTLEPFYKIHGGRHYGVYWDVLTPEQWQARQKEQEAEQARQKELETRSVDVVRPGDARNERDHQLKGEKTAAGEFGGRGWRHATDGGWFSYEMKVGAAQPQALVATYWGSDDGNRVFDVLVEGTKVATQNLRNNKPDSFYVETYPIAPALTRDKQTVTVRFQAHPGCWAGGVFGLRVVKTEAPGAGRGEPGAAPPQEVAAGYVAYRWDVEEGWSLRSAGDPGESRWAGKQWTADFSRGAAWIGLAPPDRSLLGRPVKVRLRARGAARGHPVHLFLRTHFMTFHKVVGEFTGPGEQELVVDAPPGPGWQWFGGENDGKLHGPLRLAEVRLEAAGLPDRPALELLDLTVDVTCPANRRCVLVAEATAEAGKVRFGAWARALSDAPLDGKVIWQLRSWDGSDLGHGEQPVTLSREAEKCRLTLPPLAIADGLRFVEAEFRLEVPGQEVPPARACWVAPLEDPGDAALRPESPMGMGVYLGRLSGPDMERSARAARAAGVKWSREDFTWARIERTKGRFDWTFYDQLLDCARRHGITVYAIVGYWAPWTRPYTEEGIDDYVRFLRELVKRYHRDIKQWEIWNEPNIFFWQGPKELYATLLTKSYAAVKETDPSAEVLGLSTAGIDLRFIQDMLRREVPFDVLTIHPYRRVLDDPKFLDDLRGVSDLVRRPDGRRRPVWLTEMGWATHVPHNALGQDFQPNTQRAQAELLARVYLCAIVSGVEPRTFWYNFRNDGDDPFYFEHNMGVLTRDFQPKPAYAAYATLARLLYNRTPAGPVTAPKGVQAHRFLPRGQQSGGVIALWDPAGDQEVQLQVQGNTATLVNAVGEAKPLETKPGPESGTSVIRVTLSKGVPVYVVEGDGRPAPGRGAEGGMRGQAFQPARSPAG
jgi:hypothetical protein